MTCSVLLHCVALWPNSTLKKPPPKKCILKKQKQEIDPKLKNDGILFINITRTLGLLIYDASILEQKCEGKKNMHNTTGKQHKMS